MTAMPSSPRTPPRSGIVSFAIRQARVFLLSLGFLTRLAPGRNASVEDMRLVCVYFPLVGALLGLLLTFPFAIGLFRGLPWVQAWLYIAALVWLTRALHVDGLADVADALGSGKQGKAFQAVLKDSRVGAFGATAASLILVGQIVCAAACFERGNLLPLVYAPLHGRCLPVLLACIAPVHPDSGLGALLAQAPKTAPLVVSFLGIVLGLLCLPSASFSLLFALSAGLLLFLLRTAQSQGGYNGDFLGTAIMGGELLALFCVLV